MKIITSKNAKTISKKMTRQLFLLLRSHGVNPKEKALLQYENELYKMLGGK